MTRVGTEQFTFTVGVQPGYEGLKTYPDVGVEDVAAAWAEEAEAAYRATGCYASATLHPAAAVYRREWGCPEGGEPVAVLTGVRNPEYCKDPALWRSQVEAVALAVKRRFAQTRAYLAFSPAELCVL